MKLCPDCRTPLECRSKGRGHCYEKQIGIIDVLPWEKPKEADTVSATTEAKKPGRPKKEVSE